MCVLCIKHKVYCSKFCKAFLINRTGKRLMLSWVMLGLDLAWTTITRRVALDSGRHACFTFSPAHIATDVFVLITMKQHKFDFTCFSSLRFQWSWSRDMTWSVYFPYIVFSLVLESVYMSVLFLIEFSLLLAMLLFKY